MNKEEYDDCIKRILDNGKGYVAIKDLIVALSVKNANRASVMNELRQERISIRDICDSDRNPIAKIKDIQSFFIK